MPHSRCANRLRSLLEEVPGTHSWDRVSADQLLTDLDRVFDQAKVNGQVTGEVERTGFSDSLLEIRIEVEEDIFSLEDEYLRTIPEGHDPFQYISRDPKYDPTIHSHSNLSLLFRGLKASGAFDEVQLGGDNQSGPTLEASLGGRDVRFVFGSAYPNL